MHVACVSRGWQWAQPQQMDYVNETSDGCCTMKAHSVCTRLDCFMNSNTPIVAVSLFRRGQRCK